MPYPRPSLTELRTDVAQDIASALPGSDPLLRFSNLAIMGAVQAGMGHMNLGYLDWIAQQSVPFTATDEFLEGWAALKRIYRIPAHVSAGTVTFRGTDTTEIPAGTAFVRGDGLAYVTTATGTISGTAVTVAAAAVADPKGLAGANGNCDAGTAFTLSTVIPGVQSAATAATAFTGGADIEGNEALRKRMLLAFQNPPHGGSRADYVEWALEVAGVTRAWCVPNAFGSGTVAVYVMFDVAEAAHGGFPQGTNGVSQNDVGPSGAPRDTVATGDQLAVADAISLVQPVTALVYALAPAPAAQNFTISGIAGASSTTKTAVANAITNAFLRLGQVLPTSSTINLSDIEAAIRAVPGTDGFVITVPAGNVTTATGTLPVLGTITWAP